MLGRAVVRSADLDEMKSVYAMGFDAWGDGATFEDYLAECRSSKKYAAGQWRLLEHPVYGAIASLLIHEFGSTTGKCNFGLGSIATLPERRGQGAATRLIQTVLAENDQTYPASLTFLYSDIDADFYRRFDFHTLKPELQRYKTTTAMVRSVHREFLPDRLTLSEVPAYF